MTDAIQPPTRQTLSITAIPALGDNYIWLLSDGLQAVCIDPGDAGPVLDYSDKPKRNLRKSGLPTTPTTTPAASPA